MQELNKRGMILSHLNRALKGFHFNYISHHRRPNAQALPRQPSVTDADAALGAGEGQLDHSRDF